MPVTKCPSCGSLEFDTAPSCTRCDQRLHPYDFPPAPFPTEATQISPAATSDLLYVSIPKFIVLSVCTFGLYKLYWIYRNWQAIQAESRDDISPVWRTVFAGIWNFSLFSRIRDLSTTAGIPAAWSPIALAALGILTAILWRLPEPYNLLSHLAFLPYLPVVISANRLATSRRAPSSPPQTDLDEPLKPWHIAIIVIGGLLVLTSIIFTFIDPARPA